jgi:hypothetical protein
VRRKQAHERTLRRKEVLDTERDESPSSPASTLELLSQELSFPQILDDPAKHQTADYNLRAAVSPGTELLQAATADTGASAGLERDYNKRRTLQSLGLKSGSQITSPLPTWLCDALAVRMFPKK